MYLANATNVPVRLVTGFVIQPRSHLYRQTKSTPLLSLQT